MQSTVDQPPDTVGTGVEPELHAGVLDVMARLGFPPELARKALDTAVLSVEAASLAAIGAFWS